MRKPLASHEHVMCVF